MQQCATQERNVALAMAMGIAAARHTTSRASDCRKRARERVKHVRWTPRDSFGVDTARSGIAGRGGGGRQGRNGPPTCVIERLPKGCNVV